MAKYVFVAILLVVLGCDSGSNDSKGDSGVDPETDGSDSTDHADSMDCEGKYLFDFGIQTGTYYTIPEDGNDDNPEMFMRFSYEYNDSKFVTSSFVEVFNEGSLSSSVSYNYFYDNAGRLDWIDSVDQSASGNDDDFGRIEFTYNDEGQLVSYENFSIIDDTMHLISTQQYYYNNDGLVSRMLFEYDPDYTAGSGWGSAFEYDEKKRLVKQIELDPEDDWTETAETRQYEYDVRGRLLKVVIRRVDALTGEIKEVEKNFKYADDSGRVLESEFSDGSSKTTYDWQGSTLTMTNSDAAESVYQMVYVFTEQGSSHYLEIVGPLPSTDWPLSIYGNGYINGCVGR